MATHDKDSVASLKQKIADLENQVAQLSLAELKYRSLFELSGDALSILDLETGTFTDCNDAAVRLHGVASRNNFLGVSPGQLSPEFQPGGDSSEESAKERIMKAFTEGPQVFEWTHARLDGSTFPCLVSLSAVPVEGRKLIFAIGRDISNLIEAQEALEISRAETERAAQAKSDFLSNMSHELRTPLNSVIGFSQILAVRDDIPDSAREMINHVYRSGEHLLGVINDILDVTKIDSGKISPEIAPTSIPRLLTDMQHMFGAELSGRPVVLTIEENGDTPIPRSVLSDERKLKQILINLLSNAVKFTQEGEIRIKVAHTQGQLDFTVTDSGVGIEETEMAALFEPFVQTQSGVQAGAGTGLGLSISRSFARILGGDLTATSQVGVGTSFSLTLPAVPCEEVEADLDLPFLNRLAPGQALPSILVVDDDATNREVMAAMLRQIGYDRNIRFAVDGQDAVNKSLEVKPDAVFMDFKMPELNGDEAARRIKEHAPDTKILFVSASLLGEDLDRMLESGAAGVMSKPFTIGMLVSQLENHLGLAFTTPCQSGSGQPSRILLVDDQRTNLIIASAHLGEMGFDVDTAESGAEALLKLQEGGHACLITDCEMPEMDGLDLTRQALARQPRLLVFGYTADRDRYHKPCIAAGMTDILSKPFTREDVARIIAPCLN